MALILLGLYLLIQSSLASVDTHSKICGLDRVGYLKSSDGYYLFVNEKRVESHNLICEALGLYLEKGCQFEDGDWEWISRRYCDREFISRTTAISGRKLLANPSANTSVPDQLSRKDQREEKISAPALAVAIPGMFLLCCALMCPCFHAKKKEPAEQNIMSTELNLMDSVSTLETSSALEKIPPGSPLRVPGSPLRVPGSPQRVPPSPSRFMTSQQVSRIGSMHLSINQIIKATQNFSLTSKMGEGGLGTVYKAVLPDGQIVAVKRAKKEHFSSALDEFSNEVELLSKIEHRNLVRLLGYTDKGNERIIITEYVANGTLREHLDGQHGKILDFNQRLEISIDVASALTYLHLYAEKPIIHRDVKSSNILLTESFRAKVSDFGFAKIGPTEAEQTHILTKVRGTAGYLDPEYLKTYKLTPKSDVFSFGILLIEILSARRPVELRRSMDERITVRWAFKNFDEGNVMAILDPQLNEPVDGEVVMKMLSLAFQCAAPTRADRPVMKEVGEQLWEIRKDFARTRRA